MSRRTLLALPLLLSGALTASAATFTVDSVVDAVNASPGNGACAAAGGGCTLRAAINAANALAGGPHTINVPAGHYLLTIPGRNEDAGLTGDLDILKSMTIHGAGPGTTVVDGNGLDRVFHVMSGTTVTIDGMTIRGGNALEPVYPAGGGLEVLGDLTLTNVVVTGNQANIGGGLDLRGTLHVDRSTISENVAWDYGRLDPWGGGLYARSSSVTITNSTISGNISPHSGGVEVQDGILSMTNVTLSGNNAMTLYTWNCPTTLTNVTLVNGNDIGLSHGSWNGTHSLTLRNTLIAGKVPGDNCNIPNPALIVSLGGNLENGIYCGLPASGNLVGVDPRLGSLAQNGGPTATHAPLPGSPVLDAGALSGCPETDQRGVPRPQNGRCDIGAFEAQPGATFSSTRTIPILVDRTGAAGFTSQMTLANRGTTTASVRMTYTPASSLSSTGPGTASESLPPGQQLTFDDSLGYLRNKGIPIPSTPGQGGTLRLEFSGLSSSDASFASARTTAPSGPGRAGLAYPALRAEDLTGNPVHIFGLRETAEDRTNLALANTGTAGTIVLRVTLYSGVVPAGGTASPPVVLPDYTLGPGQWQQINAPHLLRAYGLTNAWAKVERVSGIEPFLAYAVFNDNSTDDGSYVPAVPALRRAAYHFLPVLVESDQFASELVVANPLNSAQDFHLYYSQSRGLVTNGFMTLTLQPHEQRIIPAVIDYFRSSGMPVGPHGPTLVGTLVVTLQGATNNDLNGFVGARTSAPASGGGQYGLFYPAITRPEVATSEAWVFGLQQDGACRSNLALVNLHFEPVAFRIDVFDAATGNLVGTIVDDPLSPYAWNQHDSILAPFGLTRGYVRVTPTTGFARFMTYGVNNDGANSTSGTSDGSYLAMVVGS